ncbi:MAG TPA: 16S rRNA (cytosine(1402)-N(4))-methyltransferase RsmH [Patescibacteria group bacterium]|nr:16S rRNA (cytosine(1402)-N(4))-methyltransferase RsmH [Patescibacteria group bacterium]
MKNIHTTVLKKEAVEALEIKPNGIYIDATFGFGGHTGEILNKKDFTGHVIGIEVDKEIYKNAKSKFGAYKNLSLYNRNFFDVADILLSNDIGKVDGIVFDLGTNLYQIKESGRGFSFLKNEPLDMRLDLDKDFTAEKVVNSYTRERLEEVLKNVDERFARVIAKKITEVRRKKRIETTDDLAAIVRSVKAQHGKTNPATLTFMALRIEVNEEFKNLEKALENSLKVLKSGGRLVVISFHSGEDRIVKNFLREKNKQGILKIINKKVIMPGRSEQIENRLSRSAKMRVAEVI